MPTEQHPAIKPVQNWLQDCVIGLGLCPFARVPLQQGRVSLVVVEADTEADILRSLEAQARKLTAQQSTVETTLLVIPATFADFLDFNDFIGEAENWLAVSGLDAELQIASFHPHYRFAGEPADDPANFTNRAPYPILQLLRESSVTRASAEMDTLAIPQRNIEHLRALSADQIAKQFPWS